MIVVVDASVVLELLLRTKNAEHAERALFRPRQSLHAPHLLDIEVAQVLRRYFLNGELTSSRGHQALLDLRDIPIQRYPHQLFLDRIWALKNNVTAYDAAYLALSESLRATLLTCDKRLKTAAGHRVNVQTIPAHPGSE